MIDRCARDILANAILGFMLGDIRSDTFDDTVSSYAWCGKTADESVVAICMVLYTFYDDMEDRPISVSGDIHEALVHTVVFLKTDLAYTHVRDMKKLAANWNLVLQHWPFSSLAEWKSHEHLRCASIPEYNLNLTVYKPKSTLRAFAEVIAILLIAIGVLIAILIAVCTFGS